MIDCIHLETKFFMEVQLGMEKSTVPKLLTDNQLSGFLIPNFLEIMMDNQNENWGKLSFPVVQT